LRFEAHIIGLGPSQGLPGVWVHDGVISRLPERLISECMATVTMLRRAIVIANLKAVPCVLAIPSSSTVWFWHEYSPLNVPDLRRLFNSKQLNSLVPGDEFHNELVKKP
jgi:hypothetical protein